MKINSVLKPKHMVWASGAVLAVIVELHFTTGLDYVCYQGGQVD
jgi:hypothetical protein